MIHLIQIIRRSVWPIVILLLTGWTLAACDAISAQNKPVRPPLGTPTPTLPPLPALDPAEVALGRQVYVENCAVCHGPNAEGQPNWKQPDANGNFPPAPTTTAATPGTTLMGCSMRLSAMAFVIRSSRLTAPC